MGMATSGTCLRARPICGEGPQPSAAAPPALPWSRAPAPGAGPGPEGRGAQPLLPFLESPGDLPVFRQRRDRLLLRGGLVVGGGDGLRTAAGLGTAPRAPLPPPRAPGPKLAAPQGGPWRGRLPCPGAHSTCALPQRGRTLFAASALGGSPVPGHQRGGECGGFRGVAAPVCQPRGTGPGMALPHPRVGASKGPHP